MGVSTIILGAGDAEPVAQAVELFGVDRVHDEPPIDQSIDNRSVRHFDRYSDGTRRACDRENPVAHLCQTHSAVRACSLSDNDALSIEKTGLVLF
jgi:hypothetical protein